MDLEESLYEIMKGARDHAPGKPYDAGAHPLDVGELLWRGWIRPSKNEAEADIIVDLVFGGGPLRFTMTPTGKNWLICRSAEKKGGST